MVGGSSGQPLAGSRASQATLDAVAASEHRRCLLCGSANDLGLRLRFRVQLDGSVLASFSCSEAFQSYPETLHGGVICALLDAAMTNALFSVGVVGVTAALEVRFLAPVALDQRALVRAAIERDCSPLFYLRAELEQEQQSMAQATAKFVEKSFLS